MSTYAKPCGETLAEYYWYELHSTFSQNSAGSLAERLGYCHESRTFKVDFSTFNNEELSEFVMLSNKLPLNDALRADIKYQILNKSGLGACLRAV